MTDRNNIKIKRNQTNTEYANDEGKNGHKHEKSLPAYATTGARTFNFLCVYIVYNIDLKKAVENNKRRIVFTSPRDKREREREEKTERYEREVFCNNFCMHFVVPSSSLLLLFLLLLL